MNSEQIRNKVANYRAVGIGRQGQTRDNDNYIQLLLENADNNGAIGGRTQPFINLFESDSLGRRLIGIIKECKTENNKIDEAKLREKMPSFRGYFGSFPVHPYFMQDRNGEYQTYNEGHPDEGKTIVAATVSLFIFEDEIDNISNVIMRSMSRRELVPIQETDPKHYTNGAAQEILRNAKAKYESENKGQQSTEGFQEESKDDQQSKQQQTQQQKGSVI